MQMKPKKSKENTLVSVPHEEIYRSYLDKYDRVRSCMDYEGNILKELMKIVDIHDKEVVELAAGTGKITGLLAPFVNRLQAFDLSEEAVDFARSKFKSADMIHVTFRIADNRDIPIAGGSADVVVEGWSLGYLAAVAGSDWKEEINKVIIEMERLLRPGGTIIILATLGTGIHAPKPPNGVLAALYDFLESEAGFSVTPWFKTDYLFDSVEEAKQLTTFFWSERLGDFVEKNQMRIVPECSAIWYKKIN